MLSEFRKVEKKNIGTSRKYLNNQMPESAYCIPVAVRASPSDRNQEIPQFLLREQFSRKALFEVIKNNINSINIEINFLMINFLKNIIYNIKYN